MLALGERITHHQHFADRFGSDQTNKLSVRIDHADGRRGLFLQDMEGFFEAGAMAHGRDRTGHDVCNACIRTVLLERADQIASAEYAGWPTSVDHRELILTGAQ